MPCHLILKILFAPSCHIYSHIVRSMFKVIQMKSKKRYTQLIKEHLFAVLRITLWWWKCATSSASYNIIKAWVIYRSIQVDEVGNFLYCMSYFLFSFSFSLSVCYYADAFKRIHASLFCHRVWENPYTQFYNMICGGCKTLVRNLAVW